MTKKDYIAIAAVIAMTGPSSVRTAMCDVLIPVFRDNNPLFNSVRFRAAANG